MLIRGTWICWSTVHQHSTIDQLAAVICFTRCIARIHDWMLAPVPEAEQKKAVYTWLQDGSLFS